MPRSARKKSSTGIYHIMIRGINKQKIFEQPEDYRKLLYQLRDCKEKGEFELYAYCLMPNHIHLLLKEGSEPIADTFRRLGSKYVMWFNTKYSRVGHLFQDRFKSEAVEDGGYFLTVLRYIHFNPVKAKLVQYPGEYPYSSYSAYLRGCSFVDTDMAMKMLPGNGFIELHAVGCDDNCPLRRCQDLRGQQVLHHVVSHRLSLRREWEIHRLYRIHPVEEPQVSSLAFFLSTD